MKYAILAFSRRGMQTVLRLRAALGDMEAAGAVPPASTPANVNGRPLPDAAGTEIVARDAAPPPGEIVCYTVARLAEPGFSPIPNPSGRFYGALFRDMDALLFVGAAGIAVRAIAPHVRSKTTDPAVLCVDELGNYVIPLLSGHIGGANALAKKLAGALGALDVITTATDINRRFSVDSWAAAHGLQIEDMDAAKTISAAILERDVPLFSELPVRGALPPGVVAGRSGAAGIYIGWYRCAPFETTLRLVPKVLHLGLGCRRGTQAETLRLAVESVLTAHAIDPRAVRCAASIDLKADEPGLQDYCEAQGWPLHVYSAEELRGVEGTFTPSAFVQAVTGVDNVCERAAMLGAERLLVGKTALHGVTVAVAAERAEVCFDLNDP